MLRFKAEWFSCLICLQFVSTFALAHDWPTWRFDATRSGASPEQLPAKLQLQWTRKMQPLQPAWPEDVRLQFDANYEPIVVGESIFMASSRDDSVSAIDLKTGALKWKAFADGPVRFAPVVVGKLLLFGSDDGFFYALNSKTGEQHSRWQMAPSNQRVIGNARLISVWPMRGGPVAIDGRVYFTAGVWPFEGTFLYELDVKTLAERNGQITKDLVKVTTLNDRTPQGYLVADAQRVMLPCGRAEVAVMDRKSGRLLPIKYRTSRVTSVRASVMGDWMIHGSMAYNLKTKVILAVPQQSPVLANGVMYTAANDAIAAFDIKQPQVVTTKDRRGKAVKKTILPMKWRLTNASFNKVPKLKYSEWLKTHPITVDIKAGNRLYGHQGEHVFALDLKDTGAKTAYNRLSTDGLPQSLVAANGRLLVVTDKGNLQCFGGNSLADGEAPAVLASQPKPVSTHADLADTAKRILQLGGTTGYCVAFGSETGKLVDELVRQSKLDVLIADVDVQAIRARYDSAGIYGSRVSAVQTESANDGVSLPPYLANLVVSESASKSLAENAAGFVKSVFHVLRPYGGTACFRLNAAEHKLLVQSAATAKLPSAKVERHGDLSILRRVGALPGSADWTHEYGDASNSLMSRDGRVKAPLGVLWFGGPAGDGNRFYNRHFWGPSLIVLDGRMFIQGPGKMSAIDVYTGRILWEVPIVDDENYRPGRRGNDFEKQIAGFHFLAVKDGLYLVQKTSIWRMDPATGKKIGEFKLELPDDRWGRIRVVDDLLIATIFRKPAPIPAIKAPATEPGDTPKVNPAPKPDAKPKASEDPKASAQKKPQSKGATSTQPASKPKAKVAPVAKPKPQPKAPSNDELEPLELIALNRFTGKKVWSHKADYGMPVVTLGKDRAYFFDGRLEGFFKDWKRRGIIPKASEDRFVKALDLATGKLVWKKSTDVVVTWISYSPGRDVLVASNKKEITAFRGKDGTELWKRYAVGVGFKGHPESLWDRVILWNDQVLDQRGPGKAYNLESGVDIIRSNPITGAETPWAFTKSGHHCNYAIASPHLMTFRAAAAGFCDIESGNTSRLEGFRPGCRNSLIPANGVLNAPNFAHGCVCGYSIFTSLALVHRPQNEVWSYNAIPFDPAKGSVRRIGVNFGAPGDRMSDEGTLWLDYPNVGGSSPKVAIKVTAAAPQYFRKHSRFIEASELDWVAASGVEGLSSVSIGIGKGKPGRSYTIKLHFLDPKENPGQRVTNVSIAGQVVLAKFDIAKEAGRSNRAIIKTFTGINADQDDLTVSFKSEIGTPIVSGIELILEAPKVVQSN